MNTIKPIQRLENERAVRQQIRMWAGFGNLSDTDMFIIYNHFKDKWEKKYGVEITIKNKTNVVKDLASNYRYGVLKLIAEQNPNYLTSLPTQKEGYGPLNAVVWNSNNKIIYNLQNIINTINILLQDYKIRIFTTSVAMDESTTNESILGSIYATNSVIPEGIQNSIYDYLTQSLDYAYYSHEFQHYVNAVSATNMERIRNKFLFMTLQFPQQTIPIVFQNIMGINVSGKLEVKNKIKYLMSLCADLPNNNDLEMNRYFDLNDINVRRTANITFIVANCDELISGNVDESTRYCLLFACFGVLFPHAKRDIYNKIKSYRNTTWYVKAILFFILYSEIDMKAIREKAKTHVSHYFSAFVSKFIKTHYLASKDISMQICFENVFSTKMNEKMNKEKMKDFVSVAIPPTPLVQN
jgi:hypothetical protein